MSIATESAICWWCEDGTDCLRLKRDDGTPYHLCWSCAKKKAKVVKRTEERNGTAAPKET